MKTTLITGANLDIGLGAHRYGRQRCTAIGGAGRGNPGTAGNAASTGTEGENLPG